MSETKTAQPISPPPWKWHWRLEDGIATGSVFCEPRQGQAWAIAMCPRYETQERWEANAALIAAAPTMHTDGSFLVDRLEEFERELLASANGNQTYREWAGHVAPAIARFRMSLAQACSPQAQSELPNE